MSIKFSIQTKIAIIILIVVVFLFGIGSYMLSGLQQIVANSQVITQKNLPVLQSIRETLFSITKAQESIDQALNVEDPFQLQLVNDQEVALQESFKTFDMYLAAITWGSESDAFRKSNSGNDYAKWQQMGLDKSLVVLPISSDQAQIAGQASLFHAGFSNNSVKAIEAQKKFLQLSVEKKPTEALQAEGEAIALMTKTLKYQNQTITSLSEISRLSNEEIAAEKENIVVRQQIIRRNLIFAGLIGIGILSVFALLVTYIMLVRPLKKMLRITKLLGAGELNQRIEISGQDEIGDLAAAFNEMSVKLKESYGGLEKKVDERTTELSITAQELSKQNDEMQKNKLAMLNLLEDAHILEKDLKEANNNINRQKERAENTLLFLQSIDERVYVVDTERNVVFINQTAADMVGSDPAHVIGTNISDHIEYEVGEGGHYFPTKEVRADKKTHTFPRNTFIKKGATWIPVSGTAAPIFDSKKRLVGVVVVAQDITEKYEIDQMKDNFLSVAAHQLRTPLSGIRWSLEMLLEGDAGKLPQEAKEIVKNINDNNLRLVQLVNDLLDVSRINAGKTKEEAEPINICKMLEDVAASLHGFIKERGVDVAFDNVCAVNPTVKSAPKNLFQALENILSNAIKYTPKGGKVQVKADFKKDEVIISVEDNGIGIPLVEQSRVFSKFFRAENAVKKEPEGSGLGLSVVKLFIEEAGGKVSFKSREGKGTTFYITLPAYKGD